MSAHERLAALLAAAMRDEDPVAALQRASADPALDPATRDALAHVDPDGVRVQAILVARLRFERLLQGSDEAARAYEADPRAFAATFRAYHREVPMRAAFPAAEAALFAAWTAG